MIGLLCLIAVNLSVVVDLVVCVEDRQGLTLEDPRESRLGFEDARHLSRCPRIVTVAPGEDIQV